MTQYLRCIRAHRGTNDEECRQISKQYLQCRMERYVQPALSTPSRPCMSPRMSILPMPVPMRHKWPSEKAVVVAVAKGEMERIMAG